MHKYMKKRIKMISKEKRKCSRQSRVRMGAVLIAGLLITITLAGCAKPASEGKEGDGKTASRKENNTSGERTRTPQYYFANGSLLGSFDRGGWHSL